MSKNFYASCMMFAAGGEESASQIAKRFRVTRQAVYQRAAMYSDILGLRKRQDGRIKPKIKNSGLMNSEAACP